MNTETKKLFQSIWFADAAYADFARLFLENPELNQLTDQDARGQLIATREFGRTEAEQFVASWKVRHQVTTDSGFSATVLESKTGSGEFWLSMR
jgi:hypothetical protein